ncbi:MAG: sugar phosphate isomerase/epimerase [Spirochaetales bacterium]|nr:sugar phosphate isomerase/epimerase [Spirochaetales bacterium]
MNAQNWEKKREKLVSDFGKLLVSKPATQEQRLKLSWSNWGFGMEPLEKSVRRLKKNDIEWIELHGNRYGDDLGYKSSDVKKVLKDHGMKAAGVCGMFGPENDLSSNSGTIRQNAIDFIRRQLDLCADIGGTYLLVVPGAVGRPVAYDTSEIDRSVETLRLVADDFVKAGIRAAVEPVRSAEVSFAHTVDDVKEYIARVDHPGVRHINGDVYHMHTEESNIAEAILEAGEMLINLHLADSNRCALGDGSMDIDAILMALYLIGYADGLRFATPEPLGPGGDPYPAMHGKPDEAALDRLVADSAKYWREREREIKNPVRE